MSDWLRECARFTLRPKKEFSVGAVCYQSRVAAEAVERIEPQDVIQNKKTR
jgi:hypothetical protein